MRNSWKYSAARKRNSMICQAGNKWSGRRRRDCIKFLRQLNTDNTKISLFKYVCTDRGLSDCYNSILVNKYFHYTPPLSFSFREPLKNQWEIATTHTRSFYPSFHARHYGRLWTRNRRKRKRKKSARRTRTKRFVGLILHSKLL